jgi:hydrogenase nickel incorporation protein HypA/HybF
VHEWSLAHSVVAALDRFAQENNIRRVVKVVVSLPKLAMLDREIFREAYAELSKGGPLEGSELVIEEEPPRFICRSCGKEFALEQVAPQVAEVWSKYGEENPLHFLPDLAPMFIRCPYCGSENVAASNTEIRIKRVEGI